MLDCHCQMCQLLRSSAEVQARNSAEVQQMAHLSRSCQASDAAQPTAVASPDTRQPAAALLRLRLGFQHSSRMLGSLLSNQHSSGLSGHKPWALTARTACSAVTLVAPGWPLGGHLLDLHQWHAVHAVHNCCPLLPAR